jgi:hypothetical protein
VPTLRYESAPELRHPLLGRRKAAHKQTEPDIKVQQGMEMVFHQVHNLFPEALLRAGNVFGIRHAALPSLKIQ